MPEPFGQIQAPKPTNHPTPAYTILFWFTVLGLGIATFSALIAVGTLLATARPVVLRRVTVETPTTRFKPVDPDLACDSPADCTVIYPDCGNCGEGSAVSRAGAARIILARGQTCQQWRGAMCLREPAVLYCTSGRCTLTPPPDTTDWETYTSQPLGITFRYPPEWPAPNFQENEWGAITLNVGPQVKICSPLDDDTIYQPAYRFFSDPTRTRAKELRDKNKASDWAVYLEEKSINGARSILYDYKYSDGGCPGGIQGVIYAENQRYGPQGRALDPSFLSGNLTAER